MFNGGEDLFGLQMANFKNFKMHKPWPSSFKLKGRIASSLDGFVSEFQVNYNTLPPPLDTLSSPNRNTQTVKPSHWTLQLLLSKIILLQTNLSSHYWTNQSHDFLLIVQKQLFFILLCLAVTSLVFLYQNPEWGLESIVILRHRYDSSSTGEYF